MQLRIFSVYPADRPWSVWLDRQVDERQVANLDPETFQQSDWYDESGRFLVLLHFSNLLKDEHKERAAAIEKHWRDLDDGVRERVWWLVYSGTGYWDLVSTIPGVHYFRNPVSREWLSDDEKRHFRQFVSALEADEQIGATIWAKLYPTENVAAATLLALLTSSELTDIQPAINKLLAERRMESLARAHRQFAARVKQSPKTPPTLDFWVAALGEGNYSTVRDQLVEVLGAVPD